MKDTWIQIDGNHGGGQILRAALALSCASGKGFHITRIRGRRTKPGLKRQHLTCVSACQQICGAQVEGAEMNAQEMTFVPGAVRPGRYRFDIGTGGSTLLVLQAVLPALVSRLKGDETAEITVTGGTYCPMAPTYEFFVDTLLPRLRQMGYPIRACMPSAGFYQTGGGIVRCEATGGFEPKRLEWLERGPLDEVSARIVSSHLQADVAEREGRRLVELMHESVNLAERSVAVEELDSVDGRGNAVLLTLRHGHDLSVFSEIGRPRMSAETVAKVVAQEADVFARHDVPVCRHLADQLLVPMALAKGGRFLTTEPSAHTRACAEVVRLFTGKPVTMQQKEKGWEITVPALGE